MVSILLDSKTAYLFYGLVIIMINANVIVLIFFWENKVFCEYFINENMKNKN